MAYSRVWRVSPEKLPWGSDETDPRCAALKQKIRDAVESAYDGGDEQGAVVHHVPVAPEHTALGILLLDQGLQVALGQE